MGAGPFNGLAADTARAARVGIDKIAKGGEGRGKRMTKKKLKKKDKKIAVVQLENQLDYISHLKQLMHHNQDYKPWYEAVTKILNETFGNASTELMRFEGCKLAMCKRTLR